MSERKGIHWLVWVGGGCALLVFVAAVAFVGLGVFAAKKVADVAEEMTNNPVGILAKAYALANDEVEFVEADEEAQTVTFRNTTSGETATFDFSDLQAGTIRFEGSDGESVSIQTSEEGVAIDSGEDQIRIGSDSGGDGVTIDTNEGSARFGGGDSDVPNWVPRPAGVDIEVSFTAASSDGETGAFQLVGASVDAVAEQWKNLLMSSGYTIETEVSQGGEQAMKMLVGKQESEGRQISVAVTEQDGEARAVISYTSDGR